MLSGTEFLASLPDAPGPARERLIYEAVERGNAWPTTWMRLQLGELTLFVMQDALKIGTESPVRVSVAAPTAQRIADLFDAVLPTTKIIDEAWKYTLGGGGIRTEPCLQKSDATMDDTNTMVSIHRCIDAQRAGEMGLLVNGGKHWPLTNKLLTSPGKCANYGFFSDAAPHRTLSGIKAWQPLGLAHTYAPSSGIDDLKGHVDYSQLVWLVSKTVLVNGQVRSFAEVATDAALAPLVSSEGVLKLLRLPGVTELARSPEDTLPPPAPHVTRSTEPDRLRLIKRDLMLKKPNLFGDDVREWQRFLGIVADGYFGPATSGATKAWQASHMGIATGIVDGRTIDAAIEDLATRASRSPLISDFVQAKQYQLADRKFGDVYWAVLHTMEASEKGSTAEAVASYFATTNKKASAHFNIDVDSIVQSVKEKDVAYGAPGANRYALHYEHAGFAKQSASEWADSYSMSMLDLSARLVRATAMEEWGIPARFVDREMLKEARTRYQRGEPVPPSLWGVTTHDETSKAWGLSDHYDPGPHFPMQAYLDRLTA